jgi:hypothetical protein
MWRSRAILENMMIAIRETNLITTKPHDCRQKLSLIRVVRVHLNKSQKNKDKDQHNPEEVQTDRH